MSSEKMGKDKHLKKSSKKSLRTMQKNHNRHPVREKARVVKYGTKSFGRNIWLSTAATVVMAITLIILFVTIVASVILTNTAEMMKDKIDITVYFKPNVSEEMLSQLTEIAKNDKNTKSVEVSTSQEEYDKFLEKKYRDFLASYTNNRGVDAVLQDENATLIELRNMYEKVANEQGVRDETLSILDEEMATLMISKMQSTMRIKVYDVDNLDSIKNMVENDELFVQYVDTEKAPTYDENRVEITTITSWARIARTAGVILAGVFLVISILIIFSTIRMAIFSRREEIYMMKLVGAEKGFIRGPFLVEAEICGVIAGLVAAIVSYFGFGFLAPKLTEYGINTDSIASVLSSSQLVWVFLAFVVAGIIIGRLSARLAIHKYLNKA